MGMEIVNFGQMMSNEFPPPNSFNARGNDQKQLYQQQQQQQQQYQNVGVNGSGDDTMQNDMLSAELRRMQQARGDENNALMQFLSRQQMASANQSSSTNSSSLFNNMNSSNGSSSFGSSQINNFMSQPLMNSSRDMNNINGGMDNNLSNANSALGSQFSNFMLSSFKNNGMMMNSMDGMRQMNHQMNNMDNITSAAAVTSSSVPNQFNGMLDNMPFDSSQMKNNFMTSPTMNNQGNMNMDTLGMSLMSGGMNNSCMSAAMNHPSPKEDPGWEEQYKALRAYQLQFGNCKVPARFKANAKLGRWVMTQRRQFTLLMQGFPSALTAERIRRLESLGFTWSVRPEPATTWNKKFQELKAYKATYGNCMVPQRYQTNPQLGTWVHTQRRQFKLMTEGKKSSMTREKADALDSIGFFWAAKSTSSSSPDDNDDDDDSNNNNKVGSEGKLSNNKVVAEGHLSDSSEQSEHAKAA